MKNFAIFKILPPPIRFKNKLLNIFLDLGEGLEGCRLAILGVKVKSVEFEYKVFGQVNHNFIGTQKLRR